MATQRSGSLIPPPAAEAHVRWAFRPDVEGLRAIAIALVVLYHAALGPFAGGYVGVDVFYVLSGFLITGLLLHERTTSGAISLAAFYARRARRLLPAAVLVLLVTLAASAVVLPPLLLPGVATDTAAAALYVANLRFAAQATDYFASGQPASPVLHYWSLGVEEQFYLVWPAIVLLVTRQASRPASRVGVVAVVIGGASLALSLWLTGADAPLAFYLLPARAWELAIGAVLAVAVPVLARMPGAASAIAGWAGLCLVVVASVALTDATPFPGLAALLPTAGTAMVIASGVRPARLAPARVLATAVPRFLGRISYALYLWHWPLFVLPVAAVGTPLPAWARAALVVVAVALAAATQRWVEEPLRRGRVVGVLPSRNLAMAGLLAVVVALVATGTGIAAGARFQASGGPANPAADERALDRLLAGLGSPAPGQAAVPGTGAMPSGQAPSPAASGSPEPSTVPAPAAPGSAGPAPSPPRLPPTADRPVPPSLHPAIAAAPEDYPVTFPDGCNVGEGERASRSSCLYGNLASSTTIALFGDSHAAFWFPAVLGFAEREGWRMLNLTMSSCTPADLSVYNSIFKRIYTECPAWRQQAIARLIATRPRVILVAGTHGITPVDATGALLTGDALVSAWQAGMIRTLERLIPAAGRVILLADTPAALVDPPTCLSQHPTSILTCATPAARAIDEPWLAAERQVVAETGVGFIDPTTWVCPTDPCPPVIGNLLVYQNAGHLTATFAAALTGRLAAAIAAQIQLVQ